MSPLSPVSPLLSSKSRPSRVNCRACSCLQLDALSFRDTFLLFAASLLLSLLHTNIQPSIHRPPPKGHRVLEPIPAVTGPGRLRTNSPKMFHSTKQDLTNRRPSAPAVKTLQWTEQYEGGRLFIKPALTAADSTLWQGCGLWGV